MSSFFNYRHLGFIACLLMLFANNAQAQKFCVFDVLGVQGPFYGTMLEYSTIARKWGVTLELKPYTNEEKAVEDFNAGVCDLISTTGIRARDFNLFSSSIEAIGGINNDAQMKSVIETISRPEAAKLMMQDGYEVAGVLPIGGVYLFLNDRSINSVDKIKGKKIAILAHDLVQLRLAKRLGFQALAADIDDFALKFNQGTADILPAPAIAYMPLELFKGVGNKGLVLKMPISYLSLQVVLRSDKFPANYGQKSRTYFNSMFDSLLKPTRQAEQEILYFFPAPDGEYDNYQALLRDARISMAQEGIYDTKMMSLLKKVRCKNQSNRAECTDGKE
ncbi:MAG: hypothetical protein KAY00_02920 [Agitococcus sp.]|jgi:hypothetical protein|nr:hypothetical protein [Agitococcus sp.]